MSDLLKLKRKYLQCRPITELTPIIRTILTNNNNGMCVLSNTVLSPQVHQYPPFNEYQMIFIKTLLPIMEELCCEDVKDEVCEVLYQHMGKSVSSDSGEEVGYVTYLLTEELSVTLKETRSIISKGTTGLRSWPAAMILIEALHSRVSSFPNDFHILELGCGIGLTGLCIMKLAPQIRYTFTDCHPDVLETLRENVMLNIGGSANCTNRYSAELLDWNVCGDHSADLILGADIVFDKDIIPALVTTIYKILSAKPPGKCEAIVASVIRNDETYDLFKEILQNHNLDISNIPLESFEIFEQLSTERFDIIRITLPCCSSS